MQKITNILVLVLFLAGFIGININKHYSKGKLYSVALYQEAAHCCTDMHENEMPKTNSCKHHQEDDCSCENITELIQISDNFIAEEFSLPTEQVTNLLFITLFQELKVASSFYTNFNYSDISPPPIIPLPDAQSQFGVFLI